MRRILVDDKPKEFVSRQFGHDVDRMVSNNNIRIKPEHFVMLRWPKEQMLDPSDLPPRRSISVAAGSWPRWHNEIIAMG